MSQKLIKPIEKIEFGKTLLASDLECFWGFIIYAFDSHGDFGTANHPWHKMITDIAAVFARKTNPNIDVTSTSVIDLAFMNLGRLARQKLEGDSYIYSLNKLKHELAKNSAGVLCATHTATDPYVDIAWLLVGGKLDAFIGSWNTTQFASQDEVMAGLWLTLCYVVTLWNLHLRSTLKVLKMIGDFSADDRAVFTPLIPSDKKTWGSVFVKEENSTTSSLFGMDIAYLDDPALRSITVVEFDGSEKLANRLLSPSSWTWRYGRTMEITPLYFGWSPETTKDGAVFTDWASSVLMFTNTGDNKWRTFNNTLNELVADMKGFYWKNKSYGVIKDMFKFVKYGSLSLPPATGNGGIIAHQMTFWKDGAVASTDQLYHKFLEDDDPDGHCTLMNRRVFNSDKRFLMIGDMDVEDYRIHVASQIQNVDDQAGSVADIGIVNHWLSIVSYFGFGIGKTEDEPYKIGRVICDGVAVVSTASALHQKPVAPIGNNANGAEGWTLYDDDEDLDYPISLSRTKTLFYHGRAADPYKKLAHQVVDINELDGDLVVNTMRSYFWPIGSTKIADSPIAVSAITEQTTVSDDVNNKKELDATLPLAVSATTVASAAKAVTEAKKDVTKAEKVLSEEKKKA